MEFDPTLVHEWLSRSARRNPDKDAIISESSRDRTQAACPPVCDDSGRSLCPGMFAERKSRKVSE